MERKKVTFVYFFRSIFYNNINKPSLISNATPNNNEFTSPIKDYQRKNRYENYFNKIMSEFKQTNQIQRENTKFPPISKSLDQPSHFFQENQDFSPQTPNLFSANFLNKLSEKQPRTKSPPKLNEIKGINYNFPNRNIRDDVKNLLFLDKTYQNPIEKVYEDAENPLKINKKDFIEMVSNPNRSTSKNFPRNDISNYEILKKKFVNYIHFNIHKGSLDQKIIEKSNKIKQCEEKKFKMSSTFLDSFSREIYNRALEKRIIVSFDDVILFLILL